MPIAAAGDRAILVTCDPATVSTTVSVMVRAVRELPRVLACIPGHESLLVVFDGPPDREMVLEAIEQSSGSGQAPARTHRIEVVFDGIDLDELLAHIALTREEFLARVGGVRLSVRYLGFRAGFAYCDGWPEAWRLPRRPTSRNRVPAGTFAVAGAMAGFYPIDSPGGWNLLGTTAAELWDPLRDPPNLFEAGDVVELAVGVPGTVEWVPGAGSRVPTHLGSEEAVSHVRNSVGTRNPGPGAHSTTAPGALIADITSPGQLTTIIAARDWRRVYAGVTPGGPFDQIAAVMANRGAGNPDEATLLECVLVGPTLRFRETRHAAFCDGTLRVRRFRIKAGDELAIGRFHGGLRGYLAIEGGIDEARGRWEEGVVLKRGDVLNEGREVAGLRGSESSPVSATPQPRNPATTINIINGPHEAPPLPRDWLVTNQLNRIGIRLRPIEEVQVALPSDLPSCGVQFGTLQWHPDGSLMAMGPDHPVTGGYLQPATVMSEDLWKLAQLAPGDPVTLRTRSLPAT